MQYNSDDSGTKWQDKFQSPKRKRIGVDGTAKKSIHRKTNHIHGLSDSLDLTTDVVVTQYDEPNSMDQILTGPTQSSRLPSFGSRQLRSDDLFRSSVDSSGSNATEEEDIIRKIDKNLLRQDCDHDLDEEDEEEEGEHEDFKIRSQLSSFHPGALREPTEDDVVTGSLGLGVGGGRALRYRRGGAGVGSCDELSRAPDNFRKRSATADSNSNSSKCSSHASSSNNSPLRGLVSSNSSAAVGASSAGVSLSVREDAGGLNIDQLSPIRQARGRSRRAGKAQTHLGSHPRPQSQSQSHKRRQQLSTPFANSAALHDFMTGKLSSLSVCKDTAPRQHLTASGTDDCLVSSSTPSTACCGAGAGAGGEEGDTDGLASSRDISGGALTEAAADAQTTVVSGVAATGSPCTGGQDHSSQTMNISENSVSVLSADADVDVDVDGAGGCSFEGSPVPAPPRAAALAAASPADESVLSTQALLSGSPPPVGYKPKRWAGDASSVVRDFPRHFGANQSFSGAPSSSSSAARTGSRSAPQTLRKATSASAAGLGGSQWGRMENMSVLELEVMEKDRMEFQGSLHGSDLRACMHTDSSEISSYPGDSDLSYGNSSGSGSALHGMNSSADCSGLLSPGAEGGAVTHMQLHLSNSDSSSHSDFFNRYGCEKAPIPRLFQLNDDDEDENEVERSGCASGGDGDNAAGTSTMSVQSDEESVASASTGAASTRPNTQMYTVSKAHRGADSVDRTHFYEERFAPFASGGSRASSASVGGAHSLNSSRTSSDSVGTPFHHYAVGVQSGPSTAASTAVKPSLRHARADEAHLLRSAPGTVDDFVLKPLPTVTKESIGHHSSGLHAHFHPGLGGLGADEARHAVDVRHARVDDNRAHAQILTGKAGNVAPACSSAEAGNDFLSLPLQRKLSFTESLCSADTRRAGGKGLGLFEGGGLKLDVSTQEPESGTPSQNASTVVNSGGNSAAASSSTTPRFFGTGASAGVLLLSGAEVTPVSVLREGDTSRHQLQGTLQTNAASSDAPTAVVKAVRSTFKPQHPHHHQHHHQMRNPDGASATQVAVGPGFQPAASELTAVRADLFDRGDEEGEGHVESSAHSRRERFAGSAFTLPSAGASLSAATSARQSLNNSFAAERSTHCSVSSSLDGSLGSTARNQEAEGEYTIHSNLSLSQGNICVNRSGNALGSGGMLLSVDDGVPHREEDDYGHVAAAVDRFVSNPARSPMLSLSHPQQPSVSMNSSLRSPDGPQEVHTLDSEDFADHRPLLSSSKSFASLCEQHRSDTSSRDASFMSCDGNDESDCGSHVGVDVGVGSSTRRRVGREPSRSVGLSLNIGMATGDSDEEGGFLDCDDGSMGGGAGAFYGDCDDGSGEQAQLQLQPRRLMHSESNCSSAAPFEPHGKARAFSIDSNSGTFCLNMPSLGGGTADSVRGHGHGHGHGHGFRGFDESSVRSRSSSGSSGSQGQSLDSSCTSIYSNAGVVDLNNTSGLNGSFGSVGSSCAVAVDVGEEDTEEASVALAHTHAAPGLHHSSRGHTSHGHGHSSHGHTSHGHTSHGHHHSSHGPARAHKGPSSNNSSYSRERVGSRDRGGSGGSTSAPGAGVKSFMTNRLLVSSSSTAAADAQRELAGHTGFSLAADFINYGLIGSGTFADVYMVQERFRGSEGRPGSSLSAAGDDSSGPQCIHTGFVSRDAADPGRMDMHSPFCTLKATVPDSACASTTIGTLGAQQQQSMTRTGSGGSANGSVTNWRLGSFSPVVFGPSADTSHGAGTPLPLANVDPRSVLRGVSSGFGSAGSGSFSGSSRASPKAKCARFFAVKKSKRVFKSNREHELLLREVNIMCELSRHYSDALQSRSPLLMPGQSAGACSASCREGAAAGSAELGISGHEERQYGAFILQVVRAWQEEGYIYVQSELAPNGTLTDLLTARSRLVLAPVSQQQQSLASPSGNTGTGTGTGTGTARPLLYQFALPEPVIGQIVRDILSGLAYIHAQGYVHLDIKPANVLITECGRCKIGDFGLVSALGSPVEDGREGDTVYMCAELLQSHLVYAGSMDVFSFGMMVFELATGVMGARVAVAPDGSVTAANSGHVQTVPHLLPSDGDGWQQFRTDRVPCLDSFGYNARFHTTLPVCPAVAGDNQAASASASASVTEEAGGVVSKDYLGYDRPRRSPQLVSLLASCLRSDPADRPGAQQLLMHYAAYLERNCVRDDAAAAAAAPDGGGSSGEAGCASENHHPDLAVLLNARPLSAGGGGGAACGGVGMPALAHTQSWLGLNAAALPTSGVTQALTRAQSIVAGGGLPPALTLDTAAPPINLGYELNSVGSVVPRHQSPMYFDTTPRHQHNEK